MIVWNSLRDRIPKPEACGKMKVSTSLLARKRGPAQDRKRDHRKVKPEGSPSLAVYFQHPHSLSSIAGPTRFAGKERADKKRAAQINGVSATYPQRSASIFGMQANYFSSIPLSTEFLLASQSRQHQHLNPQHLSMSVCSHRIAVPIKPYCLEKRLQDLKRRWLRGRNS